MTKRTLSTGKEIRVISLEVRDHEGSKPVLDLEYATDINMGDREDLQREVREIGPDVQEDAERANISTAIVWAHELHTDVSTAFRFERDNSGQWHEGFGSVPGGRGDCGPSDASAPLPLIDAALVGDTARVMDLIKSGEDVNVRDESGATPLLYAMLRGRWETARALIDAGADVDAAINPEVRFWPGSDALMIAAWQGEEEVVQKLIQAGADVNRNPRHGYTALACAALRGWLSVARRLIAAGADVNARTDTGSTPLMIAAEYGSGVAVPELLATGANVNASDHEGRTALIYAALRRQAVRRDLGRSENCYLQIARALVLAGADPNGKANDGKSAVLLASEDQDTELLDALRR